MKNTPTELYIFDFDGTLVYSPLPDTGKELYEQKTGQKWPHTGWWSRRESIDPTIFNIEEIESVVNAYREIREKDNAMVVMMTGRITRLEKQVKAILESKGLVFDMYLFNTGGETCDVKIAHIESILEKTPSIKYIHAFDDRQSHIPRFETFFNRLVGKGIIDSFDITVVPSENHSH